MECGVLVESPFVDMCIAASVGDLALLRRLNDARVDPRAPWDDAGGACLQAARGGHLECLRYAHEHGAPWDVRGLACCFAAIEDRLECMAYAHEHGAPWPERACTFAAARGHLECLRYAHQHGAPWGARVLVFAIAYEQEACIRYALCVNRYPECNHSLARRLRAAVRALEDAWVDRRVRRKASAAVAVIEAAWLEACYRPGGCGAVRAGRAWGPLQMGEHIRVPVTA